MLLKSKYLLADKSISDKQIDRYSDALDEYFSFIDEYPDSKHKKEIEKFYEKASKILNYQEQLEEEETNIN